MNLPATVSAPFYKRRRIGTLHALSKALGLSLDELQERSRQADNLYRLAKSITKSDGSIRNTYDANEPLKTVHRQIKREILDYVKYPYYLTGSIKGRDYKINASLHTGAKIVINEDIKGFFPSTSSACIFKVWREFFCFSDEVAQCLTKLTTRKNELPQGAITSSFLANLVFWQHEPTLYDDFFSQGLVYSRYVDDVSVSSRKNLSPDEKTSIIRKIYGMLFRYGYQPKRGTKHDISTANNRMEVTKLAVNAKPGLTKSDRSQIRAAVQHLERRIINGETLSFDSGPYAQVLGKIRHMERFHPGKAALLKKRLSALKENYSV